VAQRPSAFRLPFCADHGKQFIFMADRWRPRNPIDGRYVWLPIRFDNGLPVLEWKNNWNLASSAPAWPNWQNNQADGN
jgi:hypothetical protein